MDLNYKTKHKKSMIDFFNQCINDSKEISKKDLIRLNELDRLFDEKNKVLKPSRNKEQGDKY